MPATKEWMFEIEEIETTVDARIAFMHGKFRGPRGAEFPVTICVSGRSKVFPIDPRKLAEG